MGHAIMTTVALHPKMAACMSLWGRKHPDNLRQTCRQDISGPNRCHFITIRHKRESDIEGNQEIQFGPFKLGPKCFVGLGIFGTQDGRMGP